MPHWIANVKALKRERDEARKAGERLAGAAREYVAMIDRHYGDDFLPVERRRPRMALDDAQAAWEAATGPRASGGG